MRIQKATEKFVKEAARVLVYELFIITVLTNNRTRSLEFLSMNYQLTR